MTELDESRFGKLADETLGRLFECLEDAVGDRADVEFQEGILTIDFEDAGSFVINKNHGNRQIWLASPISGAVHFVWDDGRWISTRGGAALMDVLAADVSELAGQAVTLE